MGPKPDLVIPIRFDGEDALKALQRLQQAGEEAGKKTAEGMQDAKKATSALEADAAMTLRHFQSMVGITAGIGAVSSAISTVAAGLKEAADNAARMTAEFNAYRRAQIELAGVQGVALTNQFTAEQAQMAAQAGISPQQFTQFQQSMQEQIAGNIGPGRQLTQEQANMITQKVSAFGVARGISSEAIATLTGGLVRGTQGGPNADQEVLDRFGKLINLMDASPGRVELLLPELNEVLATGATPEEAGAMVSVMAGRGRPREAGTYARALQRSISQLLTKVQAGKAQQDFGIKEGMTDIEAAGQIFGAAQQEGVDFSSPRAMRMWLGSKGFESEEEQQALMASFNLGIRGGGFAAAQETIAAGGVGQVDKAITRFQTSDEGKQQRAEAQTAMERLRIGQKLSPFALAQQQAEAQLTKEGRFTQYGVGDFAMDLLPDQFFGDRRTTLINQRALKGLEQQAVQQGVSKEQLPFGGGVVPPVGMQAATGYADTILQKIEENTRAKNAPLSAPAPQPQTRTP